MSSIINKVKDAVTGGHHDNNDHTKNTAGPHGTDAANRADPRVDSDRDGSNRHGTTGTGFGGTTGTHGSSNYGPYDSNAANKLDPRVDSDRDGSHHTGTHGNHGDSGLTGSRGTGPYGTNPLGTSTTTEDSATHGNFGGPVSGVTGTHGHGSTNYGPHDSNAANKLDPRVDSDRDGSNRHGTTGYGTTGNTSSTAGSHNSNIANKLDPRVDSDRDGSHNTGAYGTTGTHGSHGTHGTTGTGYGTTGTTGTHGSSNYGPHDSNVANRLDPRVDSDRDGSRTTGNTTHGSSGNFGDYTTPRGQDSTSTHGLGSGTHGSNTYGSNTYGSNTHGSDNHGPHNSNILNKLDPRVDSDRDGSRNVGNNNTTGTSGTGPYA